jgi:outer membrane protein
MRMIRIHSCCVFLLVVPAISAAENAEARPAIRLTLKRAVDLAISPEGNTRIQLSGEGVKQARSRALQARASLLPDFESSISQQSVTRNLETLGLGLQLPFGIKIPRQVGPFNVFDVRATAVQNVFDFSSIRRFQAARAGVGSAKSDNQNTEEQVAAQVAKAYLAALRAEADLDAVRANVDLAGAILRQAQNLKAAGTGTGIEITRAGVELSNQRQRQLVAENNRRRSRLQLLRAMNLRLDTEVEFEDRLTFEPLDAATIENAREEALASRSDMRAQLQREDAARLSASATKLERLPSLAAFADYGTIGTGIDSAVPTRTYGVSLRIPVFDGGRRDARREESASLYRQERIRTSDLRDQIELEIQIALDALRSAAEQVQVAQEGLGLATSELAQARRRYEAGVANGLEVTDAQTRLERARDNHTAALFAYNSARFDLGQATGTVRRMLR